VQVSIDYLDWKTFSQIAGANFEATFSKQQWESDDGVQGMLEIDTEDDPGDSYHAWDAATEILTAYDDPTWGRFFAEAFFSQASTSRNDLGCNYSPELLAATISNDTVRELLTPLLKQTCPLNQAFFDANASELHKEIFTTFADFDDYVTTWLTIWTKACDRGHGICYHIG